jgi:hypothetical protein
LKFDDDTAEESREKKERIERRKSKAGFMMTLMMINDDT